MEVSTDGYHASDRGWGRRWKKFKRRLERKWRNRMKSLQNRYRNEKNRLNARWVSRKRSWERRWRNTKRSMENRWANTKRGMETRWRNTKKQMEQRWSRTKGHLENRLRKAKAEVGRWKKSYDELRRKVRKYAKYADPNYLRLMIARKAHEYVNKHWTRLKTKVEKKWIKGKRDFEKKLKEVKDKIKKARRVMRQIPYYWKMIKDTRQFVRDYKPKPPNRMDTIPTEDHFEEAEDPLDLVDEKVLELQPHPQDRILGKIKWDFTFPKIKIFDTFKREVEETTRTVKDIVENARYYFRMFKGARNYMSSYRRRNPVPRSMLQDLGLEDKVNSCSLLVQEKPIVPHFCSNSC